MSDCAGRLRVLAPAFDGMSTSKRATFFEQFEVEEIRRIEGTKFYHIVARSELFGDSPGSVVPEYEVPWNRLTGKFEALQRKINP